MLDLVAEILRTSSAAITVSSAGARAVRGLHARLARHRQRRSERAAFLELLGIGPGHAATGFWLSTDHPSVAGREFVEADVAALAALLGQDAVDALAVAEASATLHLTRGDLDRNIVLIGSPESEPLTRLIFGYEPLPNGRGLHYRGDTIPLAYRWHEERLAEETLLCLHRRPGGIIAARPNWPLMATRSGDRRIPLKLDADGYLAEDYLVVTVLPNFVTDAAWESGSVVVSVAGVHSIGTRALATLLDDADAIADVRMRVAQLPSRGAAFQIVVRVTSIDHDEHRGSLPRRTEVFDVVDLELPDRVLLDARQRIVEAAPRWSEFLLAPHVRPPRNLGFELTPPFTAEHQQVLKLIATRRMLRLDGPLEADSTKAAG